MTAKPENYGRPFKMMTLHYSQTSPFVRKIMVLLHELGKTDDVTLSADGGTALDPAESLAAHNPLGKIPALQRPDGCTLYDSRVICQYLDAQSQSGLYPASPRLWETLTLEATADGILDAAVLMVYEARLRPPEHCLDVIVEAQWLKVSQALDAVNSRWMAHLAGPMDMSHIAMGCALGYLDFRQDARNWRAGRDALAAWYETFAQRPSMQSTLPPT